MNALESARALQACTLSAVDGEIGRIEQFYFDERQWAIRYLVVNTGNLPAGERRLISPVAIGDIHLHQRTIHIELTGAQVHNSPPLDTCRPVSREFETRYFDYYGWPPYWRSSAAAGAKPRSTRLQVAVDARTAAARAAQALLHGTAGFAGFGLAARDGAIGRVAGFIIDSRYWVIRYLRVDTDGWRPGGEVLVSPAWIERIDWHGRRAWVAPTRTLIARAPQPGPTAAIDRDYEARLFRNYGYRGYWLGH